MSKDLDTLFDDTLVNARAKIGLLSKYVAYMHQWNSVEYDEYLSVRSDGCTIHLSRYHAIEFESEINKTNKHQYGKTSDGLLKISVSEEIFNELLANEKCFISKTDHEVDKLRTERKIEKAK